MAMPSNRRGLGARPDQRDFSRIFPEAVYSAELRERKASTMVAVLRDFFGVDLGSLTLLDIGSSTGIIARYLSEHFGRVVGIDVDRSAIDFAQRNFKKANLNFALGDALDMAFEDHAFDVIICAHIYEHVADARRLMDEIYRVLKPGGACYFAACNRLSIREPHYRLPFLSMLPRRLSHLYLRLTKKGTIYRENLLTYKKIHGLVERFLVVDYTRRIVKSPRLFHADYMIQEGTFKFRLANFMVRYAYALCPTYIWLLVKSDNRRRT